MNNNNNVNNNIINNPPQIDQYLNQIRVATLANEAVINADHIILQNLVVTVNADHLILQNLVATVNANHLLLVGIQNLLVSTVSIKTVKTY
jgi:hypothetical protein